MYDLEKAKSLLAERLPAGHAITAITPMTTGFSNDTYLVKGPDLILRFPPAAGAMLDGHDVIGQAHIYQALGETVGAPPVPHVALVGDDSALLGAPFFLMARVAGEAVGDIDFPAWFSEADEEARRALCRQWVSAFAGLANLPPLAVLGEAITPADDMRRWQRFADKANCPALVASIGRLLAHPAPRSGPPSLVHGDVKLSNLMWDDFRISAMLDWEMALNGEPLSDLGYMLYLFESDFHGAARPCKLPGMLARQEAIDLWCEVSGRSAEGLIWHEIAQIAKITAIIAEGLNMYETGRSADPKLAYFKQNFTYYLGVVDTMLDASGF